MDPALVKYNSTVPPYKPHLYSFGKSLGETIGNILGQCDGDEANAQWPKTDMQSNRYKYFRWTARTGWLTVAYVIAFPAFIGYLGMVTDVSANFLTSGFRYGGQ